ncbi:MAG: hypothetical protein M3Q64_03545, partial [bacterium]|nr:hypothetical protein [bacterium]
PVVNTNIGNTNSSNNAAPPTNTSTTDPEGHYTNKVNGYSFDYPKALFVEYQTTTTLPHDNSKVSVDALKHELPMQYCAPSGQCRPTTINMSVGSTMINGPIEAIQKTDIGSQMIKKQLGDLTVYELEMGAEGEGIVYYYIPMPSNKILVIFRTFIDESTLISYKGANDFIPLAEQKRIFDQIVLTLN